MLITPLFLLGFLGVALPWWLHRLETQTTEREKFSSTRFLEASKKRIHVQRKLKYLILMALRMAFLALLALAFARPVLFNEPDFAVTDDTVHHVIVLDTSFSMHQGSHMQAARDIASTILNNMGSDDIASLYAASSGITAIAGPSDDTDELVALLGAIEPDNGRLDLGAMVSGLDGLIEDSRGSIMLHVISDFQQTSQALRFADMIPDVVKNRPVTLDIRQVDTSAQSNMAVEDVVVENRNSVIATLHNFNAADSSNKQLELRINNELVQQKPLGATDSGTRLVTFNDVMFAEGDNRVDVSITPSDNLPDDDIRHNVFDNAPPAPVLLLTSNTASLGVTYISAALETAPRGYKVEAVDIKDLDARVLQRYPWLIIEDIGDVNTTLAAAIHDYINGGGAVLAAAGPRSAALDNVPILEDSIGSPQLGPNGKPLPLQISRIDTSHPVLHESSGWSNVNVHALPVEVSSEDRVLVAQNARTPVLIERNIGAGRFMLLTTSLDNSASDLPVKPVFVTFMAEVAKYLSNENLLVKQQTSDSFLQLTQTGGASGQVVDPEGETLLSLQDTTRNQDVLLNKTGYYQVFTPAGEVLVAVNPDIRESDLTLMPAQTLQNWESAVTGTASTTGNITDTDTAGSAEPDEVEIWRIFLVLMALMVLAESLLGNRYLNLKTGAL